MNVEKNKSVLVLDRDTLIKRVSEYDGPSIASQVVEAIKDDLSGRLFDDGVNFMTGGAAKILAGAWPPEMEMNLDFLFELTADVCVELAAFEGDLVVNYVRSISSNAAEVLSFRKGGVSMQSLDVTDDRVIEFLSKVGGDLRLPEYSKISEKAAVALAKRKAETVLNACAEGRLEDFVKLKEGLGDLLVLDDWLKNTMSYENVKIEDICFGCVDSPEMQDGQSVTRGKVIYLNNGPVAYIGIKEFENGRNIGYISKNGRVICVYRRLKQLLVAAGYKGGLDQGGMPHAGPSGKHAGNISFPGNDVGQTKQWLGQYFTIKDC